MPPALTYPGVYIEEVPSGVRTITGVATSIAAFVGRAPRGPTNRAVPITSFGDYERIFGGLNVDSTMSYAVRDFYLNGGAEAIIVRLYQAPGTGTATAKLTFGTGVILDAISEGSWGSKLTATIDRKVSSNLDAGKTFNLTVTDTSPGGKTEKFLNVTAVEGPRRIDRVLAQGSQLVVWSKADEADLNDQANLPEFPTAAEVEPKQTAYTDAQELVKTKEQDLATAKAGGNQDAIDAAQTALDTAKKALQTATGDLNKAKALFKNATLVGDKFAESDPLGITAYLPPNGQDEKKGIYALAQADLFNILCIPPDTREGDTLSGVYQAALTYCVARRAILLVDSPKGWNTDPLDLLGAAAQSLADLGLGGDDARNAAVYYPRVLESDPLRDGQILEFVPCGIIAGIMARTDVRRGVWKAPAGLDASLNGTAGLSEKLNDLENGKLNQAGINCLRSFPAAGRVVWGSRTMRGGDSFADEYKYVPVRRTVLFIEESLYRGTQWVVFEPNDEPLWAQIRLNLGAFLHGLFRQGAFQGKDPREAYFVRCDKTTTTQTDINLGIVNVIVGVALLRPAEFVVIKIQQIAGAVEA